MLPGDQMKALGRFLFRCVTWPVIFFVLVPVAVVGVAVVGLVEVLSGPDGNTHGGRRRGLSDVDASTSSPVGAPLLASGTPFGTSRRVTPLTVRGGGRSSAADGSA